MCDRSCSPHPEQRPNPPDPPAAAAIATYHPAKFAQYFFWKKFDKVASWVLKFTLLTQGFAMATGDVISCLIVGGTVYGVAGALTQEIYWKALDKRVTISERVAVALIWPIMLALTIAAGFGRLLLRMIAIPRKVQNTINAARVEARGVAIVQAPSNGHREDPDYEVVNGKITRMWQ